MDAVYRDRSLWRTPGEEAWRAKEQGRECRNRNFLSAGCLNKDNPS